MKQARTLTSVGFQGGEGEEGREKDQAAAVTQQSISWNRSHTTQIPDCHQPSARKKRSGYVKEQIARMGTQEGHRVSEEEKSELAQKNKSNKCRVSHKKLIVRSAWSAMRNNKSITVTEA